MTVVLELSPELEAALKRKATIHRLNVEAYLERLVEQDVDPIKSLDLILAPIRKSFAESGMSEDELDELIENERQAMWDEKHGLRT